MSTVVAEALTFTYAGAERPALDGISFEVREGEIFGVLGANGAGKTTLMKILATVFVARGGRLEVFATRLPGGEESVRRRLGVAFAEYERAFSYRLTGRQNLEYFSAMYGIPRRDVRTRVESALAAVSLAEKADVLFSTYSTGMKHRLALARALLPDPALLILDEPTAGLDAQTARELGATVRRLAGAGTSVVYTTHRLEEAAALCDRVLILREGRVAALASPSELARLAEDVHVMLVDVQGMLPDDWGEARSLDGVVTAALEGRARLRLATRDVNATTRALLPWLDTHKLGIAGISTAGASLTDAFIAITEGRITGGAPS